NESAAQGAAQSADRPAQVAPNLPSLPPAAAVTAASAGLKGIQAANPAPPSLGASANCGENQVEVDGDYCPALEQKCVRWMDPETTVPRRCSEFAPSGNCQGKTVKKHFCVDKFEYPNRAGANPTILNSWTEAATTCSADAKRLCRESEWTLACEGQQ